MKGGPLESQSDRTARLAAGRDQDYRKVSPTSDYRQTAANISTRR